MQALKNSGKVQHVGIAVRGNEAARAAIESNFFETIQVAYSILDQRMAPDILESAQKNNVGVINRSVLLKGVLTRNYSSLPDSLAPLKEAATKADAIAQELGTVLPALGLQFVLSNSAISTALVGTMKIEHLAAAQKATTKTPLPDEVLAKLKDLAISDPDLIDPAKWPPPTQTV